MKNTTQYVSPEGRRFHFNDHVCVEMLIGVPDEKRTGRLVQVRKGCGQFGSDVYFLRLRDESLMTFSNAMIRHVDDERFVDAFYRFNGRTPPVIPPQAPLEGDTEETAYSICSRWAEAGFVIENSSLPQPPGCFSLVITTATKD